jgi:AcrR family transcriptional regulator
MPRYTTAMTTRPTSQKAAKPSARKPAKPTPRAAKAANGKAGDSSYHHGDLHGALLRGAETVLERDGLQGLTLRAVAREAGVSHAAPTHHFGDLSGLVSELAATGFRSFNDTMIAAAATGTTPLESALARAKAYLAYARARPGMYRLMFRTERLDMTRPALREAAQASFAGLASVVGAQPPGSPPAEALTMDQAAHIARTWSLVHGFTMLTLDGRLGDILRRLPDGTDAETLFTEMLKITVARP